VDMEFSARFTNNLVWDGSSDFLVLHLGDILLISENEMEN
jgi:hypothetical protein